MVTQGGGVPGGPATILPLDGEVSLEDGGGKGANLARLVRARLPVPPGFVIATAAYRGYVSGNGFADAVLEAAGAARIEEPASLEAASTAIRARFAAGAMAPEVAGAIRSAYSALGRPPVAGACTLKSSPNARVNLVNASMSRNEVGNHTGPRQFELPPLILTSASAGS